MGVIRLADHYTNLPRCNRRPVYTERMPPKKLKPKAKVNDLVQQKVGGARLPDGLLGHMMEDVAVALSGLGDLLTELEENELGAAGHHEGEEEHGLEEEEQGGEPAEAAEGSKWPEYVEMPHGAESGKDGDGRMMAKGGKGSGTS